MIQLVINADDLGLHPRIDDGILLGHRTGVVSSATVLVTGRTAAKVVPKAVAQGLSLGVHLCLTSHLTPAAPAALVRWLAPGGRFRRSWSDLSLAWLAGLVPADEVASEFRAQVDRARTLGMEVDHLDTHQHLHLLPGMTSLVEGLAAELDVPVRWPKERPTRGWLRHPRSALKSALLGGLARLKPATGVRRVRAHGVFESGRLTEARLVRLIDRLSPGSHEIVCHPGLAPGVVKEDPTWRYDWETELAAVTSPRVREAIDRRGISLVGYAQLPREAAN